MNIKKYSMNKLHYVKIKESDFSLKKKDNF